MESSESQEDNASARIDAQTAQEKQPVEQEQEKASSDQPQKNGPPEESANVGEQTLAEEKSSEDQENRPQEESEITEIQRHEEQQSEERQSEEQQQDKTVAEKKPAESEPEGGKEKEDTALEDKTLEVAAGNDQQNGQETSGQSAETAEAANEQPHVEESQPERESSGNPTTQEAVKDEVKDTDEGETVTSSIGTITEQESSAERKEEKPKRDAKFKKKVQSKGEEHRPRTSERPTTQQSVTSLRGESRQERKKREKRTKRRSRHSTGEPAAPKLKKKSRGSRQSTVTVGESMKQLEVFIVSLYQPHDEQRSGYVDQSLFWQVLESNLQLSAVEVATLQAQLAPKQSGLISYEEFAPRASDMIASLYQDQPLSDEHWVQLKAYDGSMIVSYNKKTGEIKDLVESGADLFEGVISELFQLADQGQKGYVSKEEFTNMLQSSEMLPYLQQEDILQMQQYFNSIPGGQAAYADFYPLAKEIILRVYRVKDPSESEWCQLNSTQVGLFWFNKYTGEARRIPADDREQEIDFLTRTYNQMEGLQAELEQCKQRNRDLENTLAQANEEQEALAAQLYETGHALDEANNEVQHKEHELDQMNSVVSSKEQEILILKQQVAELEKLQEKLALNEQELQNARKTIEARDDSISERDTNISDLRKQTDVIADKLKTANGVIDARDSSIVSLQNDLQSKDTQVRDFEKQVPELESKVAATVDELQSTKQTLEEKKSALSQTRKHLKNAREKNMDLEKELEKLNLTQEKLHNAESEIRTLKSFLTTKTAIVEKRKRELRDTKAKMSELEEKDARRAVILADVLEKTARQYQQQLGTKPVSSSGKVSPRRGLVSQTVLPPRELRCASAPAIPPEGEDLEQELSHGQSRKGMLKSYTMDGPMVDIGAVGGVGIGTSKPTKTKARSRTVPKLPPIRQTRPMQRTRTFAVPTAHDIQRHYRDQDMAVIEHASSNPQCNCELCRMNTSVVGQSTLRPETGLTSKTAGAGYQGETDVRELALSRQLQIGQRILVLIKKTEFDLEPQQLTGIVKFVGKIDSEYIDNRIYVGVKLDEAVGNTDGLIKGKRYFTCPPKHGKVVRVTSVVAILPNKSVCYRPLQKISKRSPYTTVPKKVKISSS